jgi:hypothetical protein
LSRFVCRLQAVIQCYAELDGINATRSPNSRPLFSTNWAAVWAREVVPVQNGCLSDPDGIELYQAVSGKFAEGMQVYISMRGTNKDESFFSQSNLVLSGNNTSIELADAVLLLFIYRFQLDVRRARLGAADIGHMLLWVVYDSVALMQQMGLPIPDAYKDIRPPPPTTETFGAKSLRALPRVAGADGEQETGGRLQLLKAHHFAVPLVQQLPACRALLTTHGGGLHDGRGGAAASGSGAGPSGSGGVSVMPVRHNLHAVVAAPASPPAPPPPPASSPPAASSPVAASPSGRVTRNGGGPGSAAGSPGGKWKRPDLADASLKAAAVESLEEKALFLRLHGELCPKTAADFTAFEHT